MSGTPLVSLGIFAANVLNLVGVGLTAFPPLWVGWNHVRALRWKPDRSSGSTSPAVDELHGMMHDFFKGVAEDFKPWHFEMMIVGVATFFISALLNVVLAWPW